MNAKPNANALNAPGFRCTSEEIWSYTSDKVLGCSPVTNVIRKLEKELTTNDTARFDLNCLQLKTDTGSRAVGHVLLAKMPLLNKSPFNLTSVN